MAGGIKNQYNLCVRINRIAFIYALSPRNRSLKKRMIKINQTHLFFGAIEGFLIFDPSFFNFCQCH